jgi:hypothetical protein
MGQRGTRMAELVLSESAQALALRCRIVLACAEGGSNIEVAERLGVSRMTAGKWRSRFLVHRHLVATIRTWITNWNDEPKPFIWHKTADEILDAHANCCNRISDSGH